MSKRPNCSGRACQQRDRILAVIKLASDLGADTAVLAGADVAAELVRQAQALNCATVVVGRPRVAPLALAAAHADPAAGDAVAGADHCGDRPVGERAPFGAA